MKRSILSRAYTKEIWREKQDLGEQKVKSLESVPFHSLLDYWPATEAFHTAMLSGRLASTPFSLPNHII